MVNIHENYDNYMKSNDICLKFFELGISDVSKYDERRKNCIQRQGIAKKMEQLNK